MGKHQPLITKEIFEKTQTRLITYPKSGWGEKKVIFKGLFRCGRCGFSIIGEEKMRFRKWSPARRHVYYHCNRQMGTCKEPYISEIKLVKEILRYINFMNIAHPGFLKLTEGLESSISSYKSVREEVLYEQDINPNGTPLDIVNFARYVLAYGSEAEKRDLVVSLGGPLFIKDRFITSSNS